MYIFQSMLSAPRTYTTWDTANHTALTIGEFYNTYTEGYLTLKDNVGDTVYAKVSDLPYGDGSIASIISAATLIPTIPDIPVAKTVQYADAIQVGYHVRLTSIANPTTRVKSDLHDAHLYIDPRYKLIHRQIHDRCLVTVNGLVHRTYMTPGTDNLYIERAGDTLRRGTNNHVGVLDFTSIGTLVKVTPKVSSVGPNVPYKEGVRLTVPATPSTSVFLVLGGYLVFVDGLALTRVSDTDYILDIRHIPFVERISESSEYMQMNDLGLSIPFDAGDSYSVEEVMSDAVIDRYITAMTQSFMVVCPVVSIVIEEVPIRKVGSIGTFITYQEPKYPLRLGYGKLSEYWKISEGAKWAVKVSDYVYGNYVLAESPVSASRHHPYSPYMYTNAHLLKITGYKI